MRLKSHLHRMLGAANRRADHYGFLVDQRSSVKGRRLYKQWQQYSVSSIPEMEILRQTVNSDDIVFDIGANVGEFSFFLSTIISDGLIYAFEPQDKPFEVLRSVCRNMKAVVPYNLGFSSSSGEATLHIPIVKGHVSPSEASLDPRFNDFSGYERRSKSTGSSQERIRLTTLDEFCETSPIDRLDFVKIDVEGHELEILKGGNRTCLGVHRPIFLIEVFPYVYQGHFENVCEYLELQDYVGFVIDKGDAGVEPLSMNNVQNSPGFNYFYVPREKAGEFLYRIHGEPTP